MNILTLSPYKKKMLKLFLLFLIFNEALFEETNNVKELIQSYEQNLNSSISLDREDKVLMNSWSTEFQLNRINLTTKYRLQMTRHKEHSFMRTKYNTEWLECIHLHKREIRRASKDYYKNESDCLTTATMDDVEKTYNVQQVEKEMRRWRKGYRYLVNTCKLNNPNDEQAAEACLVDFMEKDNYSKVIQRLIILKLQAIGELYLHLTTSVTNLEECLKNQLSFFLDKIRLIMESLNKCYELKTKLVPNTFVADSTLK